MSSYRFLAGTLCRPRQARTGADMYLPGPSATPGVGERAAKGSSCEKDRPEDGVKLQKIWFRRPANPGGPPSAPRRFLRIVGPQPRQGKFSYTLLSIYIARLTPFFKIIKVCEHDFPRVKSFA